MPTRKELIASGAKITPLTREEILMQGGKLTPLNVKEKVLKGIVGGGGGGGGSSVFEYESGTKYIDASYTGEFVIPFEHQHTTPPSVVCLIKEVSDNSDYQNTMLKCGVNFEALTGLQMRQTYESGYHYDGQYVRASKGTSNLSFFAIGTTTDAGTKWSSVATNEGVIYSDADSLSTGTYRWFAAWINLPISENPSANV